MKKINFLDMKFLFQTVWISHLLWTSVHSASMTCYSKTNFDQDTCTDGTCETCTASSACYRMTMTAAGTTTTTFGCINTQGIHETCVPATKSGVTFNTCYCKSAKCNGAAPAPSSPTGGQSPCWVALSEKHASCSHCSTTCDGTYCFATGVLSGKSFNFGCSDTTNNKPVGCSYEEVLDPSTNKMVKEVYCYCQGTKCNENIIMEGYAVVAQSTGGSGGKKKNGVERIHAGVSFIVLTTIVSVSRSFY